MAKRVPFVGSLKVTKVMESSGICSDLKPAR
jgi:hypothetical protein